MYIDSQLTLCYWIASDTPDPVSLGTFEYGDFKYHSRGNTGYFEEGEKIDVIAPRLGIKHEVESKLYLAYVVRSWLYPHVIIRYLKTGIDIKGPVGTFEYGETKFIPRTFDTMDKQMLFVYRIDSYVWNYLTNGGLGLQYRILAAAENVLDLVYNVEEPEEGAITFFIRYNVREFVTLDLSCAYNITASFATFSLQAGPKGYEWEDDFDEYPLHPRWQVSPSMDRIAPGVGDGTALVHGEEPVFLFTEVNKPEWSLEAIIDYHPMVPLDQGGLMAWGAGQERLGLFWSEIGGDEEHHPYLRLIGKDKLIQGWSSIDGEKWVFRGAERLPDIHLAGFGLLHDIGENMVIEKASGYKGGAVSIRGLYPGMKARLTVLPDGGGDPWILARGVCRFRGDIVQIPVGSIKWPFKGELTLYDGQGGFVAQKEINDICGGDEWYFFVSLQVRFNNIVIEPGQLIDSGAANAVNRLNIFNHHAETTPPLRMSLRLLTGEEPPAEFAPDDEGEPGEERSKWVDIDPMSSGDEKVLWLINNKPETVRELEERYIYQIVLEVR